MERGDSWIKFAGRWAALGVWVGMIGATMDLDTTGDQKSYQPVTGGR